MNKLGFVFGSNGVGKGTLSQNIAENHDYLHLNMGNMIREWIEKHQRHDLDKLLDEGEFIDDEIVEKSINEKLELLQKENLLKNIILDGVPRKLSQVEIVKNVTRNYNYKPDWIIVLNAPLEDILERVKQRVVAPDGNVYHLVLNPPPAKFTSADLKFRPDDRPEIVKKRYNYFMQNTISCLDDAFFLEVKRVDLDARKTVAQVCEEANIFLNQFK